MEEDGMLHEQYGLLIALAQAVNAMSVEYIVMQCTSQWNTFTVEAAVSCDLTSHAVYTLTEARQCIYHVDLEQTHALCALRLSVGGALGVGDMVVARSKNSAFTLCVMKFNQVIRAAGPVMRLKLKCVDKCSTDEQDETNINSRFLSGFDVQDPMLVNKVVSQI
ncbi:hypothetical protein JOB18_037266 [Solea senegalensis]|uniref:Uncharacterized protein n=1 Tax=Solea senegalensis TaxID=28829 RepID=A0AAV6RLE2_SOLSE|nr:hypothetical protein JOB18_037266 [Solea senegalensis]